MQITGKVHCLFEQSGTFKNEFIKLGIPAEDYDIHNILTGSCEFGRKEFCRQHNIDLENYQTNQERLWWRDNQEDNMRIEELSVGDWVRYDVHQLQHALRLAGVGKEIEV